MISCEAAQRSASAVSSVNSYPALWRYTEASLTMDTKLVMHCTRGFCFLTICQRSQAFLSISESATLCSSG